MLNFQGVSLDSRLPSTVVIHPSKTRQDPQSFGAPRPLTEPQPRSTTFGEGTRDGGANQGTRAASASASGRMDGGRISQPTKTIDPNGMMGNPGMKQFSRQIFFLHEFFVDFTPIFKIMPV